MTTMQAPPTESPESFTRTRRSGGRSRSTAPWRIHYRYPGMRPGQKGYSDQAAAARWARVMSRYGVTLRVQHVPVPGAVPLWYVWDAAADTLVVCAPPLDSRDGAGR